MGSRIMLGQGFDLVPEEELYALFAPHAVSLKSFRAWLRAMRVPFIRFPNGSRWINYWTFKSAVWLISRPNLTNFAMPASGYGLDHQAADNCRTTIDDQYIADNWRESIGEMLLAKRLAFTLEDIDTRKALEAASFQMVNFTQKLRERLGRAARKEAKDYVDIEEVGGAP